MRPKNKYQRRVVEVDNKMKPIGKRIVKWANEEIFDIPAYRNKSGIITCLKCNHKWKSDFKLAWHDEIADSKCPKCKRNVRVIQSQKRKFQDETFFSCVIKLEEFQVIRTFMQHVYYATNKPPRYDIREGFRIYLDKDGNRNVIGKLRQGGYYYWTHFQGTMELRQPDTIDSKYSEEGPLYPKWNLQDYVIKAGFNAYVYEEKKYTVSALLKVMLTIPNLETIERTKDKDLYAYAFQKPDDIKKYWSTIKICWRNKYKIKSWRSYFDMIKAMQRFGKDLRNRHYVCPGNFEIAHNYWTNELYKRYRQIQEVRDMRAEERQKMRDFEYQQALMMKKDKYNMRMLKFEKLEFAFGNLRIRPLMTVDAVEEAGELMHHCIYKTDSYWTDKDNLLLATYEKDKLIETTQYSLSKKEIYHSFGKFNKESKHHKKILKMITTGQYLIEQCLVPKAKQCKTTEMRQSA